MARRNERNKSVLHYQMQTSLEAQYLIQPEMIKSELTLYSPRRATLSTISRDDQRSQSLVINLLVLFPILC